MRQFITIVETAGQVQHIDHLPEEQKALALAAFQALADGQRHGPPERLGGASLYNAGIHVSGLYAGLTEHVGDITHRMADDWSFYHGNAGNCLDKVELGLRRCADDIAGQVERNYRFCSDPERDVEHARDRAYKPRFTDSLLDYRIWWREAGARYAEAHAALTVWNEAQWHAREAAVQIGRLRFWKAREHLGALQAHLGSGEAWREYAGQVTIGPDGTPQPFITE